MILVNISSKTEISTLENGKVRKCKGEGNTLFVNQAKSILDNLLQDFFMVLEL